MNLDGFEEKTLSEHIVGAYNDGDEGDQHRCAFTYNESDNCKTYCWGHIVFQADMINNINGADSYNLF